MDCATLKTRWSEVIDGRATRADHDAVSAHFVECAACERAFADYRRLFSRVREAEPKFAAPPKFRLPPELPGMGDRREASPSRFRRWAAAAVIVGGLVLSHSMTFRIARETNPVGVSAVRVTEPPLASAFLPSALRDHVDATDLLVRSAMYMPESAGERAKSLLVADLARLDLDGLSARLRAEGVESHPEHGRTIAAYLQAADAFRHGLCDVMARTADRRLVEQLHDVAQRSDVTRVVEPLRPVVASLAAGTCLTHLPGIETDPRLKPLQADERVFIGAKQARLEGRYNVAVANYQRFDRELARSPFAPLARYMMAESLYRGGDLARAYGALERCNRESVDALAPGDPLSSLVLLRSVDGSGALILKFAPGSTFPGMRVSSVQVNVAPPSNPGAVVPRNLVAFCERRGLVPHLRMIGSGTMALDIYRDGKPLLTAEYPRLFANAAYLARHPDALPDSMGPSEIEPTPDLDVVPIAPVR